MTVLAGNAKKQVFSPKLKLCLYSDISASQLEIDLKLLCFIQNLCQLWDSTVETIVKQEVQVIYPLNCLIVREPSNSDMDNF